MTKETDTMASLPLLKDLTYREWHHMVNGFYCGVRDIDDEPDAEVHYWRAGWLLGTVADAITANA
jgi:hypothetical protein